MKLNDLLKTLYTENKIYLSNKHGVFLASCTENTFNKENNFAKYGNCKIIYVSVMDDEIEIVINRVRR